MLTTASLTATLAALGPEEQQRQAALAATLDTDGEILAAQILGASVTYWLTTTPAQASLLLALSPRVDRAHVWDRGSLTARLGTHTSAWTLEQLAAGLFAALGPEPRVTPLPWLRRLQRWLAWSYAKLPFVRPPHQAALSTATSVDVSTVLSIGAATLLDHLAQSTYGHSLDQLEQPQLDALWKRGNALVLASRVATLANQPLKVALLTTDATPTKPAISDRGHGMYL